MPAKGEAAAGGLFHYFAAFNAGPAEVTPFSVTYQEPVGQAALCR
jgi:hypothetical protein